MHLHKTIILPLVLRQKLCMSISSTFIFNVYLIGIFKQISKFYLTLIGVSLVFCRSQFVHTACVFVQFFSFFVGIAGIFREKIPYKLCYYLPIKLIIVQKFSGNFFLLAWFALKSCCCCFQYKYIFLSSN